MLITSTPLQIVTLLVEFLLADHNKNEVFQEEKAAASIGNDSTWTPFDLTWQLMKDRYLKIRKERKGDVN